MLQNVKNEILSLEYVTITKLLEGTYCVCTDPVFSSLDKNFKNSYPCHIFN